MITVLLLDWPLGVRRAFRARLSLEPDLVIVGEADDAGQAVRLVDELTPDVVLVDAESPDLDLSAFVSAVGRQTHRPSVVVLTLHTTAVRHMLDGTPAHVAGKHEGLATLVSVIRASARVPKARRGRPRRRRAAA